LTFPLSYAVIFLAGALFWWGCHTTLCFTREAPYPVANPRQSFTGFLRGLGEIVRGDAAFRSFIVFLLLASGNAVSGALYTAYPLDRFMGEAGGEARDFYAGICNVVIGVSFALGAVAAGHVSRLLGERKGLAASVVFSLCAPAAALLAPSRTVYFVTFVFHGLSMGFLIVCLMSILLLFSSVEDRLRYIAIGSTVRGVGSAVYSTAGGIVASVWDPRYAFALTMVFMAAALGVLLTRLREAGRS
jgi:MFS family permease